MKKDSTPHETGKKIEGHGRELYARVMARKAELEEALAEERSHTAETRTFNDMHGYAASLSIVNELLTGDTSDIREPTASHLNQWLESTKSLPAVKRTTEEATKTSKRH